MTGMIALFGIAWLADTFVQANIDYITELLSDLVTAVPFAAGGSALRDGGTDDEPIGHDQVDHSDRHRARASRRS